MVQLYTQEEKCPLYVYFWSLISSVEGESSDQYQEW